MKISENIQKNKENIKMKSEEEYYFSDSANKNYKGVISYYYLLL
jgi:hypothetical protein